MTTIESEALILRSYEYKEKDAIVTVLLEDKTLDLLARGVQSIQSKNRSIIQPFSYVNITYQEKSNRFPILMFGEVKKFYYHINEDLEKQMICLILNDCVRFLPKSKEIFSLFNDCWNAFHNNSNDALAYACILLKEAITNQGITPYLDGCVSCGRKNRIETFSLKEGGFLCSSCNAHRYKKWSKEDLICILSLFRSNLSQIEKLVSLYDFNLDYFFFLLDWLEYHLDYKFSSYEFLKTLIK